MTDSTKYVTISDEQILGELSKPTGLLIVGQTGSGKTKLINRILRHLEQQSDSIYLFVSHDLTNHTGDSSYGHLNALRLNLTNLENVTTELQNTAIEFYPANQLTSEVLNVYCGYISRLSELCENNNKKLVIVSDDNDSFTNEPLFSFWQAYKRIISLVNEHELDGLPSQIPTQFKIIQL
jgi:GTPase SAR1 family protein